MGRAKADCCNEQSTGLTLWTAKTLCSMDSDVVQSISIGFTEERVLTLRDRRTFYTAVSTPR